MQQAGRKSAAALSVVSAVTSLARIAPPGVLTDSERALWLSTVNSKPAEWFGDEHVPMLAEYVRHVTTAELLTGQIAAFKTEWLIADDGPKRYEILLRMRARETGMVNTLARAMRLTQQSIYRADKAATLSGKGGGRRKPWQSE